MSTNSNLTVSGRIDIKEYDEEQLSDDWDSLSDSEKLSYLRETEPVNETTDYNTTVDGMHEYFAANIDPSQTLQAATTHLAIGNDNTAPSSTNSTLNNEIFRKQVTDHTQNGNEILASTFVDSNEANGTTFREVGLFAGPNATDRMWNHATIADISKDSSRTITIDVTLTFTAA